MKILIVDVQKLWTDVNTVRKDTIRYTKVFTPSGQTEEEEEIPFNIWMFHDTVVCL